MQTTRTTGQITIRTAITGAIVVLTALAVLAGTIRPTSSASIGTASAGRVAQVVEDSHTNAENVAPNTPAPDANTPPKPGKPNAIEIHPSNRGLRDLADARSKGIVERTLDDDQPEAAEVIVTIVSDDIVARSRTLADETARMAQRKKAVLRVHQGIELVDDFENLPSMLVSVSGEEAMLALANLNLVEAIAANHTGDSTSIESLPQIRQPAVRQAGHTGAGTIVAVLDTGVDQRHPDFGSCGNYVGGSGCRVIESWDFAANDGAFDDNASRHGTNVAAIVTKVAPGAKIISADVFEPNGGWSDRAILGAISYLRQEKAEGRNIVAMNLSLGVQPTYFGSECDGVTAHNEASNFQAMASAFKAAYRDGIIPVVAAGNDAVSSGRYRSGLSYPACLSYALSVGAVYDYDGSIYSNGQLMDTARIDKVTYFSQSSSKLDVWAPGAFIDAGGASLPGTSQAAPHVAGAIAVLKGAKPSASAYDTWSAVLKSSKSVTDSRSGITKPRLDLTAAFNALAGGDSTAPKVTVKRPSIAETRLTAKDQIPVRIKWSATDASGISKYDVWVIVDGEAKHLTEDFTTSTSGTWLLTPGRKYQFAVRAKDRAGNWSDYRYTATFTPGVRGEGNEWVEKSGSWRYRTWSYAQGGRYIESSTAGDTVSYTFNGRAIAVVAPQYDGAGRVHLYLDGKYKETIDFGSSTTRARKILGSWTYGSKGTHTITLKVEGTQSRPSFGLDAFVVLW